MPSPRTYYLDTSAYLTMLLGQDGAKDLERELKGGRIVSSVLLVIETTRNLVRLSRSGLLSARDFHKCQERVSEDLEVMQLRALTIDLCIDAGMPVVSTPRTLDLAHLRTALWFHRHEPLTRLVSLDSNQNDAAREVHLPV